MLNHAESSKLPDEHRYFGWEESCAKMHILDFFFAEAWYQPFPKTRADISCIESCLFIFGETLPSSYLSTSWFSRSDLHSVRGRIIPTSAWRHPNEVHADFTRLSIAGHSQEGPGGYFSLRCHCSSSFGQTESLHLCRWFDAWWS